jgi:hypothetical protein
MPDWRDSCAYATLLELERSGFAWEWLRRDEGYRRAFDTAQVSASGEARLRRDAFAPAAAEAWGLHAFEDPDRASPCARPVWRAGRYALVLSAFASPGRGDDAFDLGLAASHATVLDGGCAQHVLLSDGWRSIRLDVRGEQLAAGPVLLHYRLAGRSSAEGPLLVLNRLLGFLKHGRMPRRLFTREARAARWVLLLRTADALAAGATQRDIAAVLLAGPMGARWRVEAGSVRSRAQRLVRLARHASRGGYVNFLRC